ncbi:MAG: alpha-glucan family phosphorylase [Actinomycetales bacterium]
MRAIRRFTVRTVLPEPLEPLGALALNLRWSWHVPTLDLFAGIDPLRWQDQRCDPVRLLGGLSSERLAELAADGAFVKRVRAAAKDLDDYLTRPRWYQSAVPDGPGCIAYFSPEFGITSALPQYSGGLGILAGDHLKSASDLGVPLIGVGLLYKAGYFKQGLNLEGWQVETYPVVDPDGLPLTLLREADGTPAMVRVELPAGRTLAAHVWRADVGRVPLLLLDSDVPENDEAARVVTDRLYGGGGDHRLQQEVLLGIGGVRALRLFSRLTGAAAPEVFHTNEGHAGFLGLERIRELMDDAGLDVDEAVQATRANTVFTTHTPVPAGIDRFGVDVVATFLGASGVIDPVPIARVLELGSESYPGGTPGVFNMAVMGLRLAQRAGGVSRLHGSVSRAMFAGLWPDFDQAEVPIGSITNGVHAPTWVDRTLLAAGGQELSIDDPSGWQRLASAPAERLWQARRLMREQLVGYARGRVRKSWLDRGASPAELGWVDEVLDPDVLTIGFARRVPTYKRLTLMLRDPERLTELLLDPERPIQLVIAGKSHPDDDMGKRLIQQLVHFADDPRVRHRIVFLPNYDIEMAQVLYPGCDVWLNNPLRPLEACGTSGMKAALNGGLNLSILDGWWQEWFDGENGWAIPTADGVDDPGRRDDLESAGLYDLIARQVAPAFYDRDEAGVPAHWMSMVQHTLGVLGPKVLATRMVRDYIGQYYLPAARAGAAMAVDDYAAARSLAEWVDRVRSQWRQVTVEHVESSGLGDSPQAGEVLHTRAFVTLGDLEPEDVSVEIVFGSVTDSDLLSDYDVMPLAHVRGFEEGRHEFAGDLVLEGTGSFGYTVRILPRHRDLASSADLGLVVNA